MIATLQSVYIVDGVLKPSIINLPIDILSASAQGDIGTPLPRKN